MDNFHKSSELLGYRLYHGLLYLQTKVHIQRVFYICNHYNFIGMKQTAVNIWRFYLEGFRSMTLGRTLWLIILVKLFIMFFILRLFFFPRFLNTPVVGDDKEGYVSNELIHRSLGD